MITQKNIYFTILLFSISSLSVFAQLSQEQINTIIDEHNNTRAVLQLNGLEWDNHLAEKAEEWATYLADNNLFEHSTPEERGQTGENLWIGTSNAFSVKQMIGYWIAEKKNYRYSKIKARTNLKRQTGHYTQMIWRNTKKVGCALKTSDENMDILVCHYAPYGNIIGDYPY